MASVFDILLTVSFWAAAVRIATPLIFGVLGALLCEKSGVLNLGIEGIMTVGAMSGWLAVYAGADLWTGVLVAAFMGALFGLLLSFFTVTLGLSQHASGLGVTMLATSAAYFTYRVILPNVDTPPRIIPFQPLDIPVLSAIPFLGPVLFQQTALTLLAFVLVGVLAWFLAKTPLGLAVRAVGENPSAVEAQGLNVLWLRTGAVVAGSAIMAIGGAFLTIPFMLFCGVTMHRAIGTAAAIGVPVALVGTIGYVTGGWRIDDLPSMTLGFVYLPALVSLVAASVLTAPWGARKAHALPVATLRRVFAGLLYLLATKMAVSAW